MVAARRPGGLCRRRRRSAIGDRRRFKAGRAVSASDAGGLLRVVTRRVTHGGCDAELTRLQDHRRKTRRLARLSRPEPFPVPARHQLASPPGSAGASRTARRWGWVIWIVTPDGSEARPVYTDAQAISSICWSPIENIVYFLRSQNEAAELLALDVRDPASPTPRVVMSGLPSGGNLTISADGRSLLHVRSTQSSNLARLDLTRSSSSLEFITSGTRTFSTPQVSPDGQWIAAVVGVPPRTRLVKVPISGGEPIPLTSGDNFDGAPAWSPDGTTIAFASAKAGTSAVWLIRPDGMLPYQVNDSAPSSNMLASWTPDGRLMWQVLSSGNQMNYRIRDLSSGDDSMLLSGETYGYVFLPEFSPSGKEVAVAWNRRGGPSGLYVLTWPGLIPRFRSDPYFRPVGWSADGTSIVATAEGSVWLVSMKNGQRRRLAPVSVAIGDVGGVELEAGGDVTPDGRYFVGSVTNRTADVWLIENFDPQAGVRN
jgi:Tol biopolymer transport system component